MLNAVPVVSGQALLLFRKDRSSTLDAQTARAQEQDRRSWSPSLQGPGQVARGRTPGAGPPPPVPPVLPSRTSISVGMQEEEKGREGGPDGGAPDHMDLGNELLGRTDMGSTRGHRAMWRAERESRLCWPSLLLGSTLYSHLFWKVCEAQGREMLSQHQRHGRKLYFSNLMWVFVSCPPSPCLPFSPADGTHGLWPHTQGGREKLGPAPLYQVSVGRCMRPGSSILCRPRRATGLWPFPNCEWVVLSLTVFALLFLPRWFPREAHLG